MFKDFGRDWKGAPLTDSSARINQSIKVALHGVARHGWLWLHRLDVLQQSHPTARMKTDVTNVKNGGAAFAAVCAHKPWWCLSRLPRLPGQQKKKRKKVWLDANETWPAGGLKKIKRPKSLHVVTLSKIIAVPSCWGAILMFFSPTSVSVPLHLRSKGVTRSKVK